MKTRFRKRKAYGRLVVPVLALVCLSYFGFHAWYGTFGLESTAQLEQRRLALVSELDTLVAQREDLELRVNLMSDGSLEADILDERARYMLNVARRDEVVYFNDLNN